LTQLTVSSHLQAAAPSGQMNLAKYNSRRSAGQPKRRGPISLKLTNTPLRKILAMIQKKSGYIMNFDKADPNLLHDEITTIDNALTRPWTVVKNYRRVVANKPIWWREDICAENNVHVVVGKEDYFLSADEFLMPIRKDQPPPDLRYFNRSRK
jgi:hypothetical protein